MEINMSLQPIEIIEEILGAYAEDGSAMRCDEIHAYLTAFVSGPDGIADDADAVIDAVIGDAAIDAAQRERIKEIVLQWAEELRRNLKDKQLPELPLYEDKTANPTIFPGATLIFMHWTIRRQIGLPQVTMRNLKICFIRSWLWAAFTMTTIFCPI